MKPATEGSVGCVLAETSVTNTVAWRSTVWGTLTPIRARPRSTAINERRPKATRARTVGAVNCHHASASSTPSRTRPTTARASHNSCGAFSGSLRAPADGAPESAPGFSCDSVALTKFTAKYELVSRPAASRWIAWYRPGVLVLLNAGAGNGGP